MSEPTLVHVGVRATDVEQTIRFWRDGLGMRVAGTLAHGVDLTDGYHNFRVFQHQGGPRPPHVRGLLDYLHVSVRVDDLAATAQRLSDLGFEIIWDGVSDGHAYDPRTPPSESFKVEDSDGIVVDVTANPEQWPGVGL